MCITSTAKPYMIRSQQNMSHHRGYIAYAQPSVITTEQFLSYQMGKVTSGYEISSQIYPSISGIKPSLTRANILYHMILIRLLRGTTNLAL